MTETDATDTDDYTPAEIAAVIAEAEASGAVVWPEHVPMPELRDLKFLPWERARTMGFPFNVPNGADEEDAPMMVGSHPADPRERTVAVFDEDAGDYLPDEGERCKGG